MTVLHIHIYDVTQIIVCEWVSVLFQISFLINCSLVTCICCCPIVQVFVFLLLYSLCSLLSFTLFEKCKKIIVHISCDIYCCTHLPCTVSRLHAHILNQSWEITNVVKILINMRMARNFIEISLYVDRNEYNNKKKKQ